jgi:hypothetical protein
VDEFTQGFEACYTEINDALNGAIAHMDEQKSASGTLDAVNMFIARVHRLNSELNTMKNVFANQGGM